jgi:hypothetical protein
VAINTIGQSILDVPPAKGVSLDDAVDSMKLRAQLQTGGRVAAVNADGGHDGPAPAPHDHLPVLRCMTAKEMVDYNQAFAAGRCLIGYRQMSGPSGGLQLLSPGY